jgi:hypothetical protein
MEPVTSSDTEGSSEGSEGDSGTSRHYPPVLVGIPPGSP